MRDFLCLNDELALQLKVKDQGHCILIVVMPMNAEL